MARFSPIRRSMPTPRTHSISTKVTEAEYGEIANRAAPQTVSAWARDILLGTVQPDPLHFLLLAELVALRAILVNLNFTLAANAPPTQHEIRVFVERIDAEKFDKAQERIERLRHAAEATSRQTR